MWWNSNGCLEELLGPAAETSVRRSPRKSGSISSTVTTATRSCFNVKLKPDGIIHWGVPGRQGYPDLDPESLAYLEDFKKACVRKYRHLVRTWRLLIDPDGSGKVSFVPFCHAARSLGFPKAKVLWSTLDLDYSGFITLDEWCPVSYRHLMEFRDLSRREFGNLETAFKFGMDKTGSRTVNRKELAQFCDEVGFSGDPDTLFTALDEKMCSFITPKEIEFLDKWQGERFPKVIKTHKSNVIGAIGHGSRLQRLPPPPPGPPPEAMRGLTPRGSRMLATPSSGTGSFAVTPRGAASFRMPPSNATGASAAGAAVARRESAPAGAPTGKALAVAALNMVGMPSEATPAASLVTSPAGAASLGAGLFEAPAEASSAGADPGHHETF